MKSGLPIDEALPALREALRSRSAAVLEAPTGAGKSTVVPLALLAEPWARGKRLLMLEPRRLAARAVAARMASTLGESIGVLHCVYFADNKKQAYKLADEGICGVGFKQFFHHFGFSEAWRLPEDEAKYPTGKTMLPASEITMQRLERNGFAYFGTVDDVRREMDGVVENVHPEWFVWQSDQGFLPKDQLKRQLETFGKEILPRYK